MSTIRKHLPHSARRHERAGTDARAIVITVSAHVALVLALLATPVAEPLRRSAEMVLIHLDGEAVQVPTVPKKAMADPGTSASATARRGSAPAKAAPARPMRSEPVVVAEGREAIGVSNAALVAGAAAGAGAVGAGGSADRGAGAWTGPKFRPPRVVARVLPAYPRDAFQAGLQGSVNVLVTVDAHGRVTDTRVETSSGVASLDAAAAEGVRAWTFKAAEKLGKPVEAQAIVAIDWKYRPGMTFGPMPVENHRLLQKDWSIANQIHVPGENLDALPAKAAAQRTQPCPDEAPAEASQGYDSTVFGSKIVAANWNDPVTGRCRKDKRAR
jgi:protein TonB